MVFIKKVSNADAGDADHVGGNDWDALDDYFDDVATGRTAEINTSTTFRSSMLKIRDSDNSHSYIFVASNLAADRNLTLPLLTGNDTFVTNDFAATLTNKTINATNNTITDSSVATGDLFRYDGTKFSKFAKGSASQFLRVNGSGTDLEWVAAPGGGDVFLAGPNNFGDNDLSVKDNRLRIWNPADTFRYTFVGAAITANRNFTLPLLTGDDTVVGESHTATLTNKTINATNNTITDTSTAAGDLLKSNGTKFVRMARGTANQVLRVNSGGTDLEFATIGGGSNYAYVPSGATNTITNTTAETDMLNYSVTGNSMGANGIVRFTITGYLLNNTGSSRTWTFKVKFGGTVLWEDTTGALFSAVSKRVFRLHGQLFNKNATNAQGFNGNIGYNNDTSPTSPTTGLGDLSSGITEYAHVGIDSEGADTTKDTTSSQTLQVTVTMSTNHASLNTVIKSTLVEVLGT